MLRYAYNIHLPIAEDGVYGGRTHLVYSLLVLTL